MRLGSLSGIILVVFLGTMSSCGFYRSKNQDGDFTFSQGELSYGLVNSRVLSGRCIACHNSVSAKAGVVLDNYDDVKLNLGRIAQTALIAKTMPPTGPLSPSSQELLRAWIEAGAPKEGSGTTQPNLEPTFTSIRKNIFEAKCVTCHAAGGKAEKIPLMDYAALLGSPRELVIPGNPDESAVIISIEATSGDSQMPPTDSGLGHLSSIEISTLRSWIQDGAKEN